MCRWVVAVHGGVCPGYLGKLSLEAHKETLVKACRCAGVVLNDGCVPLLPATSILPSAAFILAWRKPLPTKNAPPQSNACTLKLSLSHTHTSLAPSVPPSLDNCTWWNRITNSMSDSSPSGRHQRIRDRRRVRRNRLPGTGRPDKLRKGIEPDDGRDCGVRRQHNVRLGRVVRRRGGRPGAEEPVEGRRRDQEAGQRGVHGPGEGSPHYAGGRGCEEVRDHTGG